MHGDQLLKQVKCMCIVYSAELKMRKMIKSSLKNFIFKSRAGRIIKYNSKWARFKNKPDIWIVFNQLRKVYLKNKIWSVMA